MKSILLLIAVIAIAVPSYGALEPGDLVVRGSLVKPNPTPAVPAIFNVKPNGTIETLSTDAILLGGQNFGPVVCPDGSIVVAKAGNWINDATPTPEPTWYEGQPTSTPVPWRQSGVYRLNPDGSFSPVAVGGDLNPSESTYYGHPTSLEGIACDSKGNIFVSHADYAFPTPTPRGEALLKIVSGSAPTPFASANEELRGFGGNMTVDAADDIYVPQSSYNAQTVMGSTPTPVPGKVFKVSGADGGISTFAAATIASYTSPEGDATFWSEPFTYAPILMNFDLTGNLIMTGSFERTPSGTGSGYNVLSVNPGGAITTILDIAGAGGINLLGANGAYLGFNFHGSIYILKAGSLEEEFIVHGDQAHTFDGMAYYSPEKPQLIVTCSEDVFGPSDGIAFGFGLTRGRTANEADLYFALQFPASAGGNIRLINPNAAVNKLPALIDLALAKKYPTQISKLRYGNGTTAVKGSGTVELLKFSNVRIADGTYTLLGVMTAPGANLLDTSKWLTPDKKAVEAETTYSKAL